MTPRPDRDAAYDSNENMKARAGKGGPPRPATEPPGSEGSSSGGSTMTDPATGEPRKS